MDLDSLKKIKIKIIISNTNSAMKSETKETLMIQDIAIKAETKYNSYKKISLKIMKYPKHMKICLFQRLKINISSKWLKKAGKKSLEELEVRL